MSIIYLAKYALNNLDYLLIEETLPYIYAVLLFDLLSDFCLRNYL